MQVKIPSASNVARLLEFAAFFATVSLLLSRSGLAAFSLLF
jgi:hypothetical protein